MSLLDTARADLKRITRDTSGFSRSVTVTAPDLTVAAIDCIGADIAYALDPETGTLVSSRTAHVSADMAQLITAFGVLPRNISDPTLKPWIVQTADSEGGTHQFKVIDANPDREIGLVSLQLSVYA